MVQASTQNLAWRRFPSEPPSKTGRLISLGQGLLFLLRLDGSADDTSNEMYMQTDQLGLV